MKLIAPGILQKKIDAIDYSKLYTSIETEKLDPMNTDYTIFENTIKYHITKCKVTKNKILNLPQDEWIHNEIISEINKRNQLWTELKKQPALPRSLSQPSKALGRQDVDPALYD
ncbi:Uncharacterized protein OBRU01_05849 [Operophtera brumata]|uniref:Uncharacterized protein n=1 Tax=Operophtera brumata TaxID=104452 RepID=A0A0L7LB44_OPEBR|nr:Uncharacterized protein OBRU01_05849 [Operophtera brumata]